MRNSSRSAGDGTRGILRRLINLISAGRNRIVMIRRELPRTENAGWVFRPYRTERRRILLAVFSRSAACAATGISVSKAPLASPAECEAFGRRRKEVSNGFDRKLVWLHGIRQVKHADQSVGLHPSRDGATT